MHQSRSKVRTSLAWVVAVSLLAWAAACGKEKPGDNTSKDTGGGDTEVMDVEEVDGGADSGDEEDGGGDVEGDVAMDGQSDGSADGGGDGGLGEGECNYEDKAMGVCVGATEDPETGECMEPEDYESDESLCDDLDNDCDGVAEEGCACNYNQRSRGVCSDGKISADDGECAPPDTYETDETKCDGADNDCDGVTDENCQCDYDQKSKGVCGTATRDPSSGDCVKPDAYESTEVTCDSRDNDCDGEADEVCQCKDGDDCYTGASGTEGVGTCKGGSKVCSGGSLDSCMGEVTPNQKDQCDGQDDDCDGVVDEGCSCDFQSKEKGVCDDGGQIDTQGNCTAPTNYESSETTCDGKDNDCDGVVDEGCPCSYKMKSTGVCGDAKMSAQDGSCAEPSTYEQMESSCDSRDNDCDGQVDESGCSCTQGQTEQCYTGDPATKGVGQCKEGSRTCDSSGSWGSCMNETLPDSDETCGDGMDNDCDGFTNEGGCQCDYDSTSTGVCKNGTTDSKSNCQPPSDYELDESSCDQVDNDCDGVVDEGCSCNYKMKSDGVCGSATRNSSGKCQKPSDYSMTDTSCDGVDNDCDGQIDEDGSCMCTDGSTQDCYTADPSTAGVGECKKGSQTCNSGTWSSCQGEVTPSSEKCGDNKDSNCNGADSDGCNCNYKQKNDGVCANQTINDQDMCPEPANYEATESSCGDGVDNDCDGVRDCNDSDCQNSLCGSGQRCCQTAFSNDYECRAQRWCTSP